MPVNYNGYGMPYQNQSYQGVQPNFYPNQNSQGMSSGQLNYYAFVNGIEGAKAYQVLPNTTMLLMDSDNLVVYMKSANSLGQSTLRYFKMKEVNEQDLRAISVQQTNMTSQEYALKSDIDALNKRLDNLTKKLERTSKTSPTKQEGDE